ncbi:MAG: 1-acyl-sn-glycerol-3-phosphate acyltransferase [Cyclobacteriaceae bacterium]
MKIIKVTWYIVKLMSFILLSFFYFIVAGFVRIFNRWKAVGIMQNCLHLYFRIFGLEFNFYFQEEKTKTAKNTVFVLLNQSSFLDSMITPTLPVYRTSGIINIEFALYPVIGWFLAITGFVIVRQWSSQAKRTLNRTDKFLKSGGNMLISIEGKRTKDGKLNAYKKGAVVMAINSQSDIVPVIIEGTYASLPYKSLMTKPGNINVKLLESISTAGMTYNDRNLLLTKLRSIAHQNGLK